MGGVVCNRWGSLSFTLDCDDLDHVSGSFSSVHIGRVYIGRNNESNLGWDHVLVSEGKLQFNWLTAQLSIELSPSPDRP